MMARFYLAIARMAELVDALVSNTNGAIRAGSIPAPGTRRQPLDFQVVVFFFVLFRCVRVGSYINRYGGRENNLPLCDFS